MFEVTAGHRLTLTYNLYWTTFGPTTMADNLSAVDPDSIHFFDALHNLINCPKFLPNGERNFSRSHSPSYHFI